MPSQALQLRPLILVALIIAAVMYASLLTDVSQILAQYQELLQRQVPAEWMPVPDAPAPSPQGWLPVWSAHRLPNAPDRPILVEDYWALDGNWTPGLRLPTCFGLTERGTLSHPLQDAVQDFQEFRLANVVTRGTNSTALLLVWPGEAAEPFAQPHALLWHRMAWGNASGVGGSLFAQMTSAGRTAFCGQRGQYSPDLEPEQACDGGMRAVPITYPYCNRDTAPVAVVSVDCAISESLYAHGDIAWNLLSLSGGGVVMSFNGPGRWALPRGVAVSEYDELACAGTSVYPGAPGHFFNEILPRLVHLDLVLPARIPMLWPDGTIPGEILRTFQAAGVLSSRRAFVMTNAPRLHRARRMYTYVC